MLVKEKRIRLFKMLPSALVLTTGPRDGNAIYVTFDDGPDPEHTPRILDFLRDNGAQASFFLIGKNVEKYPMLVNRIVAEGHLIGNHSYSHPHFDKLSLAAQIEEIDRTDRLLSEFDGSARHRFRTPRGVMPLRLLVHLARDGRGLTHWSCDSFDYNDHPVDDLARSLRQHGVRHGDVILMHDDSARAEGILRQILPEWKANGISLRALPA